MTAVDDAGGSTGEDGTGDTGDALAAVAAYAVIDAAPEDPILADLKSLCELATTVSGLPAAVVNLFDARFQHQIAACGVDPTPCRRDDSMCQTTLAAGRDVVVLDASTDPRFADSPWVDGRLGNIRTYCSTILRTPAQHEIGTLCVFADSVQPISEQQVRGLQILARQVVDVLELRLRTRQLEQSHQELAESQDRLAAFAGQISHDLKAPVTAIIGFAELLQDLDVIREDPTATAYVGRCFSAGRRMLAMIEDLLAFARVGGSLARRRIALDSMLPEVLDDLGPAVAGADISWAGPPVLADAAQLRALLQNLVGNAVTYRGESRAGDSCVVRVRTAENGEHTVLQVIDNGPGIPPESREDVIRPLVRLRKDVPGAGLGLAVCTRIVAAHGGSLEIGETPGGGTTVTVRLPR
jgi:signal transduction histidine kinase